MTNISNLEVVGLEDQPIFKGCFRDDNYEKLKKQVDHAIVVGFMERLKSAISEIVNAIYGGEASLALKFNLAPLLLAATTKANEVIGRDLTPGEAIELGYMIGLSMARNQAQYRDASKVASETVLAVKRLGMTRDEAQKAVIESTEEFISELIAESKD